MNALHSTAAASLLRALGSGRRTAIDAWLGRAALVTLRYGLILILLYFGAFKFTEVEARAIELIRVGYRLKVKHNPQFFSSTSEDIHVVSAGGIQWI